MTRVRIPERASLGQQVLLPLTSVGSSGLRAGEIDLRLDEGTLTIEASQERENDYSVSSRRVHEEVTLPAEILEDEIQASYHNGVLEVRLPSVMEFAEEDDDAVHIDIE